MAGAWIKYETDTADKPEVWALAQALQIDPDAVVGKLLRVWAWFDAQTENGNAPSVTKSLLDRKVGVTGFCDEMVKAGWMLDDSETITLPNFDRHNGKTAKNRALTAKRVSQHKQKTNDNGNAQVTPSALPRKEKKREERKAIAPAARDPIWDAVISACGLADRTPTKSERGGWNKAVAELKEINVAPKQIHERAAEYRRNWPKVSLTPNALARRWNECAPSNPGAQAKTIDTMTEMELVEECRKRGINDNGMSVQQMRRALKEAA